MTHGISRFVTGWNCGVTRVGAAFDFKWSVYAKSHETLPLWESPLKDPDKSIAFRPGKPTRQAVEEYRRHLLERTGIPEGWFRGRLVLDAGCGTGWASIAAADLGARVVSFDIAYSSVEITHKFLKEKPNAFTCQADIFHLPLRHEKFDAVFSFGVLHHTPDTRKAMECVHSLIKRGGLLVIHVYEKHNPLRMTATNALRWLIQRYPEPTQYSLIEKYLVNDFKTAPKYRNRLYGLANYMIMIPSDPVSGFDAYSPRYNNVQSIGEVLRWLRELGYRQTRILNERQFHGFLPRLLAGDFGGAIEIKSIKAN